MMKNVLLIVVAILFVASANAQENLTYIDLYSHFVDEETGKMNVEYTNDGVHLLGKGYKKWVEIIKPYVDKK